MTTTNKGLEFDPGFAPYIFAFVGSVEYLYEDINRFKNFSQKKLKFRQYHKKFIELLYNNIGFYIGCLMWAAYLKTQPEQEILNNHCLGQKFDENNNTAETDFVIRFVELFPKDMKYFMGENFEFPNNILTVLNLYKEFLTINKGFVETKTTTDLLLPSGLKTEDAINFKDKIEEAIKAEDLSMLIEYKDIICQE